MVIIKSDGSAVKRVYTLNKLLQYQNMNNGKDIIIGIQ